VQLAAATGLHRTTISFIERGMRAPRLATLYALAAGLEVPVADLVRGLGRWEPDQSNVAAVQRHIETRRDPEASGIAGMELSRAAEDDRGREETIAVVFGRRLSEARVARYLSQDDLALVSGTGNTEVSVIEHGRREIRIQMLLRLAGGLGVDPADLLADDDGGLARSLVNQQDEEPQRTVLGLPKRNQGRPTAGNRPGRFVLGPDTSLQGADLNRSAPEPA
jgi:transcriptional regulator with XRE-family HTH domain